jgi:hypothetical protein
VKLEHSIIVYVMCVISVGCCGQAVPWMSVVCFRRLFPGELCCCPPYEGTELKKQVVRPMGNTLSK